MKAIEHLAAGFRDKGQRLDGIVNNVGVMTHERIVTDEGFELSYAVNLLGQYVLVMNLLPVLLASAPARIVLVSSGGMYSQPLNVENIQSSEGEYDGTAAYARTKRGQVALAEHWARAFAVDGIRVNSMHPGWVDTDGVRDALPTFRRFTRPLLRSEDQGADSIVWLMASHEGESHTGEFIHDRKPRETHRMNRTEISSDPSDDLIARLAADAAPYLTEPPSGI
jgi:NAD(P)-dependent dehydrogenase (short-subunit alcohol dehydrogenase family)